MTAKILTLQDEEFDVWKEEVKVEAKSRNSCLQKAMDWVKYFNEKNFNVKVELTEILKFNKNVSYC